MVLMNLFAGQQWRYRQRTELWTQWGKERVGQIERVAWKFITIYKTASGNLVYDAGSSNQVLCDNLEGWDRLGGGRKVQERGDICMPVADSC